LCIVFPSVDWSVKIAVAIRFHTAAPSTSPRSIIASARSAVLVDEQLG
jgi:hypothetical protein